MTTRRSVGLLFAVLLFAADAAAQPYRYVDDQGGIHYVGSRDQVPEQYRSQLPPEPAREQPKPGPQPAPGVTGRPPAPIQGECILVVQGSMLRPRDSRSYPTCDECRKAVGALGTEEASRASCIAVGQ